MTELAERVDKLTVEHLTVVIETLANSPPPVVADEVFLTYGLATEVLRFFFGNAWTNENVFDIHRDISRENRASRKFLKTESTDREEQFRHMQRVTTLAEIVFNLQGIEGLKQRITLMHNHDLEAALGELECAALLAVPEFRFKFVTPTGVKGKDYEGEIVTSAGRTVCCEMKSRSEQLEPSQQTLWSTFEHARKQLPKGIPAIVLVKIPEDWVKKQDTKAMIEAALEKIFRQSNRIVAIVFIWEEWYSAPQESKLVASRIRSYPNKRSELYEDDIDETLSAMGRAGNPSWVHFQRLVAQMRGAA
jgi:hypothetical protein